MISRRLPERWQEWALVLWMIGFVVWSAIRDPQILKSSDPAPQYPVPTMNRRLAR